ncbi:unnamed protein product, partial [Didymodactylos carnosus]
RFDSRGSELVNRISTDIDNNHETIINTEWTLFNDGDDKTTNSLELIVTKFDKYVNDLYSKQQNEKFRYFSQFVQDNSLAELLRLILLDFYHRRLLFDHDPIKAITVIEQLHPLTRQNIITAKDLNDISSDYYSQFQHIRRILTRINLDYSSTTDCIILQLICNLILKRASKLCAAAFATIINKQKIKNITIALGGRLIRENKKFRNHFLYYLREYVTKDIAYKTIMLDNVSGIGTAILTMIHQQMFIINDEQRILKEKKLVTTNKAKNSIESKINIPVLIKSRQAEKCQRRQSILKIHSSISS